MSTVITIGYVTKARDDWSRFAEPISAPSNYRDPEKIATYIRAAQDRVEGDAKFNYLTSELVSAVVAVDEGGEAGRVFAFDEKEPFFFLDSLFDSLRDTDDQKVFCHKPSLFFHVVCSLAAKHKYLAGCGLGKWLLPERLAKIYDPFRMLGGAHGVDDPVCVLDRYDLLRYDLSVPIHIGSPGRTPQQEAKNRLVSVNDLCVFLGFKDNA